MFLRLLLVALLISSATGRAYAVERRLIKESFGSPASEFGGPCPISQSTNGTAANYRWYNLCSGYIWIYEIADTESFGLLFGGSAQPEVRGGNTVKRAITYWRNVVQSRYYVNVYLDADVEGDGCPDYQLASDFRMNPGLRWNCSDFNVEIPCDIDHVVVRMERYVFSPGLAGPSLATDGPFNTECDPISPPQSFYYGINRSVCIPWLGPDGQPDNFIGWLVVDSAEPCPPNAINGSSWGAIKGLFR